MDPLTITNGRVLTLAGPPAPRRGEALRELGEIDRGFVRIENGRIADVGPVDGGANPDGEVVDVGGCVVMPGFVDCHTHACWAGQRFDEVDMKRAGKTYLEILEAGGGIMATVRAVRDTSEDALTSRSSRATG